MANKDNMRLWVAGLRSGQYEQITGFLMTSDGYCCLGVACRIAIDNGLNLLERVANENQPDEPTMFGNYEISGLPGEVQEWLGVDDPDPTIAVAAGGNNIDATDANDDLRWDFNQIADAIEAYYELEEGDE